MVGGKTLRGLDHILSSKTLNARLATQLRFTSDAYHFPVCADVT
jgi:hypothetical protein